MEDGDYPDLLVDVATSLALSRHPREAERLIRPAAEAGDLKAARSLAVALDVANRPSDGEPWARIAADGAVYGGHMSLAIILNRLNRVEEAPNAWRSAITTDPDDPRPRVALGEDLANEGLFDEAVAVLDPVAEAGTMEPSVECNYGEALGAIGEYDRGEAHLKIAAESGHEHALCKLGRLYIKIDKESEAEAAWKEAYARGHAHAAVELHNLYVRTGKVSAAARWRRSAFAAPNGQPASRPKVVTLGRARKAHPADHIHRNVRHARSREDRPNPVGHRSTEPCRSPRPGDRHRWTRPRGDTGTAQPRPGRGPRPGPLRDRARHDSGRRLRHRRLSPR